MTKPRCRNLLGRFHSRPRKADTLTLAERSARMSKIRAKKTAFEVAFIKALSSRCKAQFDTNCADVFGTPDLVFRRHRVCVFLDSDFWHGWQFPRWSHKMKSAFWRNKILSNRRRDLRVTRVLRRKGWSVIRIWEHNIKRCLSREIERISFELNSSAASFQRSSLRSQKPMKTPPGSHATERNRNKTHLGASKTRKSRSIYAPEK